jgi:hypothetical protein
MVGEYNHDPLSDEIRDNTVAAIAILNRKLGLGEEQLRFHSEAPDSRSTCPGKNVSKADVIQRILKTMRTL